ncbi:MAG TPA: hypothetical protein VK988_03085 [Acidimicrobiales bacterium]|nr:hypothetical protein [Acidimicrobiales bacterium]
MIERILDAIAAGLRTIAGLRVFDFMPDTISPPAAIVQLPRTINFDLTFGRGSDALVIPVLVVVAKVSERAAYNSLAAYLNLDGPTSVKQALDGNLGGVVDDAHVVRATGIGSYSIGGIDYMGCLFEVNIIA